MLVARALEDAGSWDGVWAATVVRDLATVDVEGDARVAGGVCTREADGVGTGRGSASGDVDLSTTNVNLSTAGAVGRVKSDELSSEKVMTGSKASGHVEVVPASLLNHRVDTPFPTVQTLLSNLEPTETRGTSARSVVNLGHVEQSRALVTGGDGVVGIVLTLSATNNVTPPSTNASASRNVDNSVVLVLDAVIAGHAAVVHVGDGVVAAGCTNTLELALILTIDRHFLEDGVAIGDRRESEESQG